MGEEGVEEGMVPASQRMQSISFGKINRLMLFREIIIINCEIHTEHKYTVWADCSVYYYHSR